jgi:hypothetical protein
VGENNPDCGGRVCPHHRHFSESDLLREEGRGEDGLPWLQMIVGPELK